MAIRGKKRSGDKAPLNVGKGCISPRKYNISTLIAVGALAVVVVLAVFVALPRTDSFKVNTTVSSSFYTKTWDGVSYVTNASFYPNGISIVALFYEQGLKTFLDEAFTANPLAVIDDTAFENETFGRGLIFYSLPGSLSNVSIAGLLASLGFAPNTMIFLSIAINANDDSFGDVAMSGGFEWQFKFMDALGGTGIGKALYDAAIPHIFTGNTDIVLDGGFYKNSTTSGLYATVNGVAMTLEEQYVLI